MRKMTSEKHLVRAEAEALCNQFVAGGAARFETDILLPRRGAA